MNDGRLFIGIDLGTSSVKLVLSDSLGNVQETVSRDYPISYPQSGWSEQNPEDWMNAVFDGLAELVEGSDKSKIAGIGCGGQMHGLVVLDSEGKVIRPCILWNDGRTADETDYLNNVMGKEKFISLTGNIAFAGFTAPKILWIKKHESDNFSRIYKIMLPKDYINYALTGVFATDYSDASGTLLLDVEHKCWSREMLEICGIDEAMMPRLYESFEAISSIKPEIARKLGLSENVTVSAGAGDNAAAAIAAGVVGEGGCNLSVGTSGTVFVSSKRFSLDKSASLHSFVHADGGYHLMGCMLSAASCQKWLLEDILGTTDYVGEASKINENRLGENDVFFLPYLMGERSPLNDTNARGTFIGMTAATTRSDMLLSVLEGVAFAIRDNFEAAYKQGIKIDSSKICGGGARSEIWRKIFASVLNIRLDIVSSEGGPAMGGAMLAMVASGEYKSVEEVCRTVVKIKSSVYPAFELAEKYENKYQKFKKIYPACKDLFAELI